MATLKNGKKIVKQDDLRRLMREKKHSKERQIRVESPHAKYNSLGQLSCALCCVPVKSELLWQTHVLGKQHKDKVSAQKSRGSADPPSSSSSAAAKKSKESTKRVAPDSVSDGEKRAKLQVPAAGRAADPVQSDDGPQLLAGHNNGSETNEENAEKAALPADFFDSSILSVPPAALHSGSVTKASDGEAVPVQKKENTAEALPEGFFDDPVRDAKIRNAETLKDQQDREWEEFQKQMRQVNSASDAIVAEEDEEGRLERQFDEIDEQMQCLQRVQLLRAKREAVKSRTRVEKAQLGQVLPSGGQVEEEIEQEELMLLLTGDWRAKGALA